MSISAEQERAVSPTAANMRGPSDFRRARTHSRLVTSLKLMLPTVALSLVAIFGVSAALNYVPANVAGLGSVGLKDGKIVMNKPKMSGLDKNNRAYNVDASRAIQDLNKPGIIELESIDAKLPMDIKSFADVTANSGVYDTDNETLILRDDVKIIGARGMDIQLQQANIDITTGSMASDQPVVVTSNNTDISADSVVVEENGDRIVFKKRVKMIIKKPVSRGTTPSDGG